MKMPAYCRLYNGSGNCSPARWQEHAGRPARSRPFPGPWPTYYRFVSDRRAWGVGYLEFVVPSQTSLTASSVGVLAPRPPTSQFGCHEPTRWGSANRSRASSLAVDPGDENANQRNRTL